jgi:hypothetical protein
VSSSDNGSPQEQQHRQFPPGKWRILMALAIALLWPAIVALAFIQLDGPVAYLLIIASSSPVGTVVFRLLYGAKPEGVT